MWLVEGRCRSGGHQPGTEGACEAIATEGARVGWTTTGVEPMTRPPKGDIFTTKPHDDIQRALTRLLGMYGRMYGQVHWMID